MVLIIITQRESTSYQTIMKDEFSQYLIDRQAKLEQQKLNLSDIYNHKQVKFNNHYHKFINRSFDFIIKKSDSINCFYNQYNPPQNQSVHMSSMSKILASHFQTQSDILFPQQFVHQKCQGFRITRLIKRMKHQSLTQIYLMLSQKKSITQVVSNLVKKLLKQKQNIKKMNICSSCEKSLNIMLNAQVLLKINKQTSQIKVSYLYIRILEDLLKNKEHQFESCKLYQETEQFLQSGINAIEYISEDQSIKETIKMLLGFIFQNVLISHQSTMKSKKFVAKKVHQLEKQVQLGTGSSLGILLAIFENQLKQLNGHLPEKTLNIKHQNQSPWSLNHYLKKKQSQLSKKQHLGYASFSSDKKQFDSPYRGFSDLSQYSHLGYASFSSDKKQFNSPSDKQKTKCYEPSNLINFTYSSPQRVTQLQGFPHQKC